MPPITFIGDLHSNLKFASIVNRASSPTIQVGDFEMYQRYDLWDQLLANKLHFIDGNHENFPGFNRHGTEIQQLSASVFYIPRGFVSGNVMFYGGADSIDRAFRTPGHNWYAEEAILTEEIDRFNAVANDRKIDVVVSHTCPWNAAVNHLIPPGGVKFNTPSEKVLECGIFEKYRPKLWIFGHWHMSKSFEWQGCKFICLNEAEAQTIDVPVNPKDFTV